VSEVAAGRTPDLRLVLSTAPDAPTAAKLARALVEERLAACVSAVPGLRSTYRWQGAVEETDEVLLVVKTTAAAAPAVAARLGELHPYEVPEVVTLAPLAAAPSYLAWLAASVGPPPPEAVL
jgi:periplasmic divalent cation tolerance protein